MKKLFVITLCLLLLCGCNSTTTPTEPVDSTTAPIVTTTPTDTTPDTTGSSEDLFALAESCIGKSVDELVALIGEPESSDYAQSCLVEGGEDGNWYYDGFTVYTLRTDEGETVEYVE